MKFLVNPKASEKVYAICFIQSGKTVAGCGVLAKGCGVQNGACGVQNGACGVQLIDWSDKNEIFSYPNGSSCSFLL